MKEPLFPIKISEVAQHGRFFAPLYLKMSGQRLYCAVHGDPDPERLDAYLEKGFDILYVKATDLPRLFGRPFTYGRIPIGQQWHVEESSRRGFMDAIGKAVGRLRKIGIFSNEMDQWAEIVHTMSVVVFTDELLAEHFEALLLREKKLLIHSIEVAFLALYIQHSMQESMDREILETIALAGLLHDLGKPILPPDIRNKNPTQLLGTESVIFNSHTQNLAILIERDLSIPSAIKELYYAYDRIEREGVSPPYSQNKIIWTVVAANRIAERMLPAIGSISSYDFEEFILHMTAADMKLPDSLWEILTDVANNLKARRSA